jgi:hypothetical protein
MRRTSVSFILQFELSIKGVQYPAEKTFRQNRFEEFDTTIKVAVKQCLPKIAKIEAKQITCHSLCLNDKS